MKLALTMITPLDPSQPYRVGVCEVSIIDGERRATVAQLEFGEVLVDGGETRSLSEFEVALFRPASSDEGHRVRVRRAHAYEEATSTLRDVWLEVRTSPDAALVVQRSTPIAVTAVQQRARVQWRLSDGATHPSVFAD